MKTIASKEFNYSLHNLENYKKDIDSEVGEIVEKLGQLFIPIFDIEHFTMCHITH